MVWTWQEICELPANDQDDTSLATEGNHQLDEAMEKLLLALGYKAAEQEKIRKPTYFEGTNEAVK